ncbi:peptidase S8 [Paenibacillaceae bacterium]|nr:peptidase S8 [Paenibacillaceae bacterium]
MVAMARPSKPNTNRAVTHPKMSPTLRKAVRSACKRKKGRTRQKSLRIILELKHRPSRKLIRSLKRCAHSGDSSSRFNVLKRMPRLSVMSARISADCLRRLCGHRHIRRAHLDRKVQVSLNVATPAVGSAKLQKQGETGKGITIAIIDTGAYPHPDLTKPVNRIIAFKDFVNGKKKPYDDNGHGTHVAGDAAGNGLSSHGKYRGPAPKAKLVIAKAFDELGFGSTSDIIAAIDWVIRKRQKYGIRIVNMSFGGGGITRCADDPICTAAEHAWKDGLLVVTSAGNAGPAPKTIESPGISPLLLTVGAVNDRRTIRQSDDVVAGFSSRGSLRCKRKKPDLVAPGTNIISLRAPGSLVDIFDPGNRVGKSYFKMSGTSMATPIVSGAAAQLLQRSPRLTPCQIKRLLKRHTFRLKAKPNAQGRGELNVRFFAKRRKCSCTK